MPNQKPNDPPAQIAGVIPSKDSELEGVVTEDRYQEMMAPPPPARADPSRSCICLDIHKV